MFVLFFLMISSPGHFKAEVLSTFQGPQAQAECLLEEARLTREFEKVYTLASEKDTYGFKCLKQKEIEA